MACARLALNALFVLAGVYLALAPARAQQAAEQAAQDATQQATHDATPDAAHAAPAGSQHACLDQKERRAEADSGRLIRLAAAIHAAKSKMPGTVVRARLCHGQTAGQDGLVYVLTVLAHDGRVRRITVDAANGTLVGER
jgi:uncharacterized membrane protein YkoI